MQRIFKPKALLRTQYVLAIARTVTALVIAILIAQVPARLSAQPLTWSNPQPLNALTNQDNGADDTRPQVAENPAGRQVCVWQGQTGAMLTMRASPADEWSSPTLLSTGAAAGLAVLKCGVVYTGSDTWIAQWVTLDPASNVTRLFTSRSTDNGVSWPAPTETQSSISFIDFDLASDGADKCVSAFNHHLLRSQDGGASWAVSSVANTPTTATLIGAKVAAAANGTWAQAVASHTDEPFNPADGSRGRIYLTIHTSTDAGASWTQAATILNAPKTALFTTANLSAMFGDLAAAGNEFGLTFKYFRAAGGSFLSAYVSGSSDAGATWSVPIENTQLYTDKAHAASLSLAGDTTGHWLLGIERRSLTPTWNVGNTDILISEFSDITTTGTTETVVVAEPHVNEKAPVLISSSSGGDYIFYQTEKSGTQLGYDWDIAMTSRPADDQAWTPVSYVNSDATYDLPARHDDRVHMQAGTNGTILAAWKVNLRHAGLIAVARSTDQGDSWTTVSETVVAPDNSLRTHYGPLVYYNGNNGYWLVAWDDDNNKFWKMHSYDDGLTWSQVVELDGPILGHDQRGVMFCRSAFNNPARTNDGGATWIQVFMPTAGDVVHTSGTNWFKVDQDWSYVHVSTDNAYSWTKVPSTNYPAVFSTLHTNHQGTAMAVITDRSGANPGIFASRSIDNGRTWSPRSLVVEETGIWGSSMSSEDVKPVWLGGNTWAMVWNSLPYAGGARGRIAISHDNGLTWGAPTEIVTDSQLQGLREQVYLAAAAVGSDLVVAWENSYAFPSTEIPYGFDSDLFYSTTTVSPASSVSDWSLYEGASREGQ